MYMMSNVYEFLNKTHSDSLTIFWRKISCSYLQSSILVKSKKDEEFTILNLYLHHIARIYPRTRCTYAYWERQLSSWGRNPQTYQCNQLKTTNFRTDTMAMIISTQSTRYLKVPCPYIIIQCSALHHSPHHRDCKICISTKRDWWVQ